MCVFIILSVKSIYFIFIFVFIHLFTFLCILFACVYFIYYLSFGSLDYLPADE